MSDEAALDDLMSLWEREQARGRDLAAAELCHDRPELTPELDRRIRALRQIKGLACARSAPTTEGDPASPGGAPAGAAGNDASPSSTAVDGSDPPARGDRGGPFPSPPGYEVLGELGRGGMGVVYLAVHRVLKRKLALKMILVGGAAAPVQLERFRVEAEAAARLQHPNIVQIYDVGEWEGRPFFSLELMEGGTLAGWLKQGSPAPGESAALVAVLARAMHYAHQRRVVHRDLKPGNVLLAPRGGGPPAGSARPSLAELVAKVGDFGLAKLLVEGDAGRTETGSVLGTPSYMAPEQAAGRTRDIGPPADVYALGAILYELLAGRPPFLGPSALETARQVIHEEPAPPTRLRPNVPRDLETICLKCLRKDPGRRYATALDLADDLERFGEGRPIRARPVPAWERLGKWVWRRPAAAALVAVSGLALAALVAMSLAHYAWLRAAVEQARGEERALREALAEELFTAAEAAAARDDWAEVRVQLAKAQGQVSPESSPELAGRVARLMADAERHLGEQGERQAARRRLDEFRALHNEALFAQTLRTGRDDPAADLEATRKAAEQAMNRIGLSPEGQFAQGAFYSAGEKAALADACYELLLILADVAAQPVPGQNAEQGRLRAREALGLLDRAARLHAPTRAASQRRARYLEQAGDVDAAAEERRQADAIPPDTALDRFLAGQEGYKQAVLGGDDAPRRLADAARHFEAALRLQPNHFWARYYLALCRTQLDRPREAMDALNPCLADRPDFVWLYLLRGFVLGELGFNGAAEQDFHTAAQLEQKKPDEAVRYTLFADRGVTRLRDGKGEEAADDFRRAIELSAKRSPAHLSLAMVYQKQQKWELALAEVNEVIQADRDWAVPYRCRARIHAESGDPEAALSDYAEAVRAPKYGTRQDLAGDHVERARLFVKRWRYPEAIAACDAALSVWPGSSASVYQLRAKSFLQIAAAEADAMKAVAAYKEAVRSLDRSLETGAPSRDVYEARALAREKSGDARGAVDDYTLALRLAPKDAALHAARGWLYLMKDAPRLAFDDFDEAVHLAPEDGNARNGRGYARVLFGEYKAAAQDAEEAVRRPPQTPLMLYTAARTFAQAVGRADADPDPARTVRATAEDHARYERGALQLIRAALTAAGDQREAFWREHVANDPALDPIRRGDGFRLLSQDAALRGK